MGHADAAGLGEGLGGQMLIYWLMFAVPALFAVLEPPGGVARGRFTFAWLLVVLALIVIIGLRWETGGDWANYDRMVQFAFWDKADFGLLGDPGFGLLTRIAASSQYGMLVITTVSGTLMSLALVRFCLAQPRPWLCLTVAVPYFVVVMGMGYIRQGMAVSLLLMALLALEQKSALRYVLWILAAALFHSTALILLPLTLFIAGIHPAVRLLILLAAAMGLVMAALSARTGLLVSNYVDEELTSSGAIVRLAMTALPGAALLYWRDRFSLGEAERLIWTLLAVSGIGAFLLVLVFPASTAIDRLGLYLLPLQIFVYARLPDALAGNARTARVVTVGIVALYAAAFYVWLNYAVNVEYWLPYRFFPFEDGVCLEC